MRLQTALDHFQTNARGLAEMLGISSQAVYKWDGVIPLLSATRLERISNRKLQVDPRLYDERGRVRREQETAA